MMDNREMVSMSAEFVPHICVCVCTYKRPEALRHLLLEFNKQQCDGAFTISAVVADNDVLQSGKEVVESLAGDLQFAVEYQVEPTRGISRARNMTAKMAHGDYVALIDDDEWPRSDWLLSALTACRKMNVDGVLGHVERFFEEVPPFWLLKSKLYTRPRKITGEIVSWREARTSNALLRADLVCATAEPFNVKFRSGEDIDFFRRKIEEGFVFKWVAESVVYETIPPARWRLRYLLKKALLRGACAVDQPHCGVMSICKSIVAVITYPVLFPFVCITGVHKGVELLVRFCDHAGKLLMLVGINPVADPYVNEE